MIIILIPLISILMKMELNEWKNYIDFNRENKLRIVCHERYNNNGILFYEYPKCILALNNYLLKNNLINNAKHFDTNKNNVYYVDEINKNNNIEYILNNAKNLRIMEDLYLDTLEFSNDVGENKGIKIKDIIYIIKSKKLKVNEIKLILENMTKEYNELLKNKHQNKIYHFCYQGETDDKLNFLQNCLMDKDNLNNCIFESFDNLVSINQERIKNDIDKLNDYEYYKKTGQKRKIGYLFYGPPGCGKSSHVMAIATHYKRHIIEIPFSRIKTNSQLEKIINLNEINDISFNKDEIIIYFDEIDQAEKTLSKKNFNMEHKKDIDDKINLGFILSKLDGIGNYNGIIFIATTNHLDKLDKALYRDGRLSLIHFNYLNIQEFKLIIKKFYNKDIDIELSYNLSHSTLINLINQFPDFYRFNAEINAPSNKLGPTAFTTLPVADAAVDKPFPVAAKPLPVADAAVDKPFPVALPVAAKPLPVADAALEAI